MGASLKCADGPTLPARRRTSTERYPAALKENHRITPWCSKPCSAIRQHGGELKTTRPEFAAVNCSKDGALKTFSSFRVRLRASIQSPIDVPQSELTSL